MRLDRAYIDGYRNLKRLEIDFDESRLTTVVIGQNGAGKSNLIEALVEVFRSYDLPRAEPRFKFEIDYRLGGTKIRLTNCNGSAGVFVNGKSVTHEEFGKNKAHYFPDLVFGYYSGGSRRMEQLFDSHQRRYYDAIKRNDSAEECAKALQDRRLFYCRPIHGAIALLALCAFPDAKMARLLRTELGISGFHSALAHMREPWFAKGGKTLKLREAEELWGALGPAGKCARSLRDCAFHSFALSGNAIDDYREKQQVEAQLGAFLRDRAALEKFSHAYADERTMFAALESVDISDLFRELHVWVTRENDQSGDISFADLSDGERQLLMVLGLIRMSRGRRALFLLDEPDTHLNPHWQHGYLDLVRDWTEVAAESTDCHIVLTSHNPLTIAALQKSEVRVMSQDSDGRVFASAPYADPRGLGFTATLTEIFGLPTSLDRATQELVDERNSLSSRETLSETDQEKLIALSDQLSRLGFMFDDREPLYQGFLQAWRDIRYANRPPLSPLDIERRRTGMSKLLEQLTAHSDPAV